MVVLLGVVGSLAGVVVGAFLTRWIDAGYERRREVKQAVASALTLQEELNDAEGALKVMIGGKKGTTAFLLPGLAGAWESHREVLLTVGMPHKDWVSLARIFRDLLDVTTHLRDPDGVEIEDENIDFLESLCRECEDCRARLKPFVLEATNVPLVRPTRIFVTEHRHSLSFAPLGAFGRVRRRR